MTVLHVPLHLPAQMADDFLRRELRFREVVSTKVDHQINCLVVEHKRKTYVPSQSIGF